VRQTFKSDIFHTRAILGIVLSLVGGLLGMFGVAAPARLSQTEGAAQTTFEKAFDGGDEDSGFSLLKDVDGNLVALGNTYSFGAGNGDMPAGIECRSGGADNDYTVVFTFTNPLTSVDGTSLTNGAGSVSSSAIDDNDKHQYVVNLTGVTNAQVITIVLANVSDSAGNNSGGISASMAVLLGDVDGNKVVSNTDMASVKAQVAAAVDASNFCNDVNANGVISNTDVAATKAQVGATLP
jgi:hypothetical protein